MATKLNRLPPIVVVLGATGAGKSKLALEIAQHFKGEVISADAMQMYKGLDIVTNKVTPEERKLVPHHLIDFLDPLSKCTVIDFRNKALPIIADLRKRNIIPVLCGGTNYYIESVLWKVLVDLDNLAGSTQQPLAKKSKNNEDDDGTGAHNSVDSLESRSTADLYDELKRVDPARSQVLHPHERRKIIRSLEVFHEVGKPHSQVLQEQAHLEGGGLLGGPLRYPISELAVLWVQCDQDVLDKRCDNRVGKMISQGLLPELRDFHKNFNLKRAAEVGGCQQESDYEVGIFQSIGFKEFHDFLVLEDKSDDNNEDEKRQKFFDLGKTSMMSSTRRYARRQKKWIRQRFLRSSDRQCPPIYGLDSTDPSVWDEVVRKPAIEIVQAFVDGDEVGHKPLQPLEAAYTHEESRQMFHCQICNLDVKGRLQYEAHMRSKKHNGLSRRANARVEDEATSRQSEQQEQQKQLEVRVERELSRQERMAVMKKLHKVTNLPLQAIKPLLSFYVKEEEKGVENEVKTADVKRDVSISDELKTELSSSYGLKVEVVQKCRPPEPP